MKESRSPRTLDGWTSKEVKKGGLSHHSQSFIRPRWCRIYAIKHMMADFRSIVFFWISFSTSPTCNQEEINPIWPIPKLTNQEHSNASRRFQVKDVKTSHHLAISRNCQFILEQFLFLQKNSKGNWFNKIIRKNDLKIRGITWYNLVFQNPSKVNFRNNSPSGRGWSFFM